MSSITIIDSVPRFITPEEHRTLSASTPASFSDIPPILRHKEDNVSITLDPALEGFSADDSANGTLYVIESVLVFMSASGRGLQVEYPSITLHAISRSDDRPSIYCQLDEQAAAASADAEPEEGDTDMRELIVVPQASSSLENIFEALSLCASLHPDPEDENDMDDDADAFIDADSSAFDTFNGDAGEELSEVGRAALAHLESIIYDPFEDAPEDVQDTTADAENHNDEGNDNEKHVNGNHSTLSH